MSYQKQTKLNTYIYKKQKNGKKFPGQGGVRIGSRIEQESKRHDSSRQNSDTQPLDQKYEAKVNLVYPKTQICYQLIMTGPFDVMYESNIKSNLSKVLDKYDRVKILAYLENNLKYQGFKNLNILNSITDAIFWKTTLKKMIQLVLNKGEEICSCISTLIQGRNHSVTLSRQQILIILSCMFLGIFPKNQFSKIVTFGNFMSQSSQKASQLKREKLLFMINYFKMAINLPKKILQQFITIHRVSFDNGPTIYDSQDIDTNIPLRSVEFNLGAGSGEGSSDTTITSTLIQDSYGNAAMVDFANKSIGGGVLSHGAVQEEILFLIFPEAIASKMICAEMAENEAIIFYGLRRYSNYTGYSYDTKFDGEYTGPHPDEVNDSVMIAIDAIDFNGRISPQTLQLTKIHLHRQLCKATAGFKGIQELTRSTMKICTGRWGCGAFKGDQIWKFFIQWLACSQCDREMIYLSDSFEIKKQLSMAVKRLMEKSVLDVLSLMEQYSKEMRKNTSANQDYTFIDYLKNYV